MLCPPTSSTRPTAHSSTESSLRKARRASCVLQQEPALLMLLLLTLYSYQAIINYDDCSLVLVPVQRRKMKQIGYTVFQYKINIHYSRVVVVEHTHTHITSSDLTQKMNTKSVSYHTFFVWFSRTPPVRPPLSATSQSSVHLQKKTRKQHDHKQQCRSDPS